MRRLLVLLLASTGVWWITAAPSVADCSIVYEPELLGGVVVLQAHQQCTPESTESVVHVDQPPTDSGMDSICVATAITLGSAPADYCLPATGESPDLTPGMVANAFKVLPLPASFLEVQPPNSRTLVNFDTNFFTEAQPFDRAVMLLGRRVLLHIVPSGFGWRFGDGSSATTDEPGSPYPNLDVTHRYLRKGHVAPSVDTTYTATYRVNGGPWREVPGSVTISGAAVELEVLTATPTLVGYDS
jgi:hypothetical protein